MVHFWPQGPILNTFGEGLLSDAIHQILPGITHMLKHRKLFRKDETCLT